MTQRTETMRSPLLHAFLLIVLPAFFYVTWAGAATPEKASSEKSANEKAPVERSASDKAAVEQKLKALRTRIETVKREEAQKRQEESSVRAELAQAETAMGIAVRALTETRNNLLQARARMGNLENERAGYQMQRDRAKTILQAQVRMAFMAGHDDYWKLLLNQQDPTRIGRMLNYYDYLNKARAEQMRSLSEAVQSLGSVQQKIKSEVLTLDNLLKNQASETKRLTALKKQREKALDLVLQEIADADRHIAAMEKDEDALKSIVSKVEEVVREIRLPAGAGFKQLKGKLGWPAKGQHLQNYGDDRHDGHLKWNGSLIAAVEGSDVRAIYHGRVVFADWLRGFGLMTIIDHGDGYMSLYGHSQALNKQVGDWVEAGEMIAQAGSTGGQNETGIYFEIRYQGQAVDPALWCKKN